jgi:hypothetical protein
VIFHRGCDDDCVWLAAGAWASCRCLNATNELLDGGGRGDGGLLRKSEGQELRCHDLDFPTKPGFNKYMEIVGSFFAF